MERRIATSSRVATTSVALEPSDIQLHGARLTLARLVCAVFVVFALSVFVADELSAASVLSHACPTNCLQLGQLTPDQAHTLAQWGVSLRVYTFYALTLSLLTSLIWFGVAALIYWRRSNTLYLLLLATQLVAQGALNTPLGPAETSGSQTPWEIATTVLSTVNFVLLCLFLAIFPNGRFAPRWLGWFVIPMCAALILAPIVSSRPDAQLNVLAICLLGLIVAQVYRYWAVSTTIQRQQTKWVILGIGTSILVQVIVTLIAAFDPAATTSSSLFPVISNSLTTVALTLGPLAFMVAIFRYRLYDLGLLINRTLVYTALTALLAAMYAVSVITIQDVVRGMTGHQNGAFAVVVSTLAVAAAFQPLRRRIQNFIDRRFYRRKYDAAKTLAAFSATVRNEVDLENLCRELMTAVDEALQPEHALLWLRSARTATPSPLPSKQTETA
ncbi:MAG TPA: hypothetical protein VF792_03395 [Ktedonobacterales bacterium]